MLFFGRKTAYPKSALHAYSHQRLNDEPTTHENNNSAVF